MKNVHIYQINKWDNFVPRISWSFAKQYVYVYIQRERERERERECALSLSEVFKQIK